MGCQKGLGYGFDSGWLWWDVSAHGREGWCLVGLVWIGAFEGLKRAK